MNNQLLHKRFPTIFGIIFIIFGIVLTTIIVRNQTFFKPKAAESLEPKNVKITNISNDTFTITYQTDKLTEGSANYGKDKELGTTELEENFAPKNIHSITVKNLLPSTKYHLAIISAETSFLNNGFPYQIETGPSISSPSAFLAKIKGKVILPDGQPPAEALVYLSSDDSQLLSSVANKNGEFNFSLDSLRTSDLSSYLEVQNNTLFKIIAISKSLTANAQFFLNEKDSIPTITLSNNYDFTQTEEPVASKSADQTVGFPTVTINPVALKPQILTPKDDQSFTDQKPQFRGTSLPNENVEITIHSDENIQAQVKADSSGNWTYRPPNNLSPGVHTITIKTRNSAGVLTTIMQSFTVFAAGSQVSESATPSATPTQKPTPTNIPTPTIVPPTPTLIPVAPFVTSVPPITKGELPPTGMSSTLLIVGGIITAVSGIVLFLLTFTIL